MIALEDKEFYQVVAEINKTVGRIEANQENHFQYLEAVNGNFKAFKKEFTDHLNDDTAKIGELKQGVGRIEISISSSAATLQKTSNDLALHIEDLEAHGEKARAGVWELVGKIVTGIVAAAGGLYTLWKMMRP